MENTTRTYRDNGAAGALLDEYQRAIDELKSILSTVSNQELLTQVDFNTEDQDCISIQSILAHVVKAGRNYVVIIRKGFGEELADPVIEPLDSIDAYQLAIDAMFKYNELLFEDYPQMQVKGQMDVSKMVVSWGQEYDIEQLVEHAIVHILRHRRQIERFLLKLRA